MQVMDLHRRLHRADVAKDAKKATECIEQGVPTDFFNTCADNLFGTLKQNYTTELLEIKNIIDSMVMIKSSKIYPKSRVSVSMLRHPMDVFVAYLPDRVEYAIQDSGLSPKHFKDITYIVTPGSYIDTAGRSFETKTRYEGFGHIIPKEDFISMGFQHISSFSADLTDTYECVTKIQFTFFPKPIVTIFESDMRPQSTALFFKGNTEKNRWFNTLAFRLSRTEAFNIGRALILCKELGDTLQVYYGKLFESRIIDGSNKVCLFTSDTVLADRCRLMELPVIVLDHEKREQDIYECFYYPVPGLVDTEIKQMFQSIVLSHNTSVKSILDKVFTLNECIIQNTRRLRFNQRHQQLFLQIKVAIDKSNDDCKKIKITAYTTIDEYRKEIMKYMFPHFFQEIKGNYHANKNIRIEDRGFEELLLESNSRRGGGVDSHDDDLSESVFNDVEYAKYGDDFMYELSLADQLKRRIYMILFEQKQPNSVLVPETERIFDYLFRQFSYVGEFSLHFDFLRKCLEIYKVDGEILNHEHFASVYNNWKPKELLENFHVKCNLKKHNKLAFTQHKHYPYSIRTTRRRKK